MPNTEPLTTMLRSVPSCSKVRRPLGGVVRMDGIVVVELDL